MNQPTFNQFDQDGVYRGSFPLAWIAHKHGLSLDVVYNVAQGITVILRGGTPSVWSEAALDALYAPRQLGPYGDIFAHVYAWETRNLAQ